MFVDDIDDPDAQPRTAGPNWPAPMSDRVRIGLIGPFLDLVAEETEADPAAILVDLLVRVGSALNRGPHFTVSGTRHHGNLFALLIGATATGRKGTSAAFPETMMRRADPGWSEKCVRAGLSSGEGLVHAVRDTVEVGTNKAGEPIIEPGVDDKRLLVVESEFARVMRAAGRTGSVLAPVLRQAWDGARTLASLTRSPYAATDAHINLLGHVTPGEFLQLLDEGDVAGGSLNRFLFVASRRQRLLPFGGQVDLNEVARLGEVLGRRIDDARRFAGEYVFGSCARGVWPDVYLRLTDDEQAPGILGSLLGRGAAQVRRLAMVFAIIDGKREVLRPHVEAATEVWRYSADTVRWLFRSSTGDRLADKILDHVRERPEGVARTELHKALNRHESAGRIDEALRLLVDLRHVEIERQATAGRPREVVRTRAIA